MESIGNVAGKGHQPNVRHWPRATHLIAKAGLIALLAITAPPATRVHAERAMAVQASVTVRGVTLTVRLPRSRYPLGALVRATVTVKNASRTEITAGLAGCRADGPNPTVRVYDGFGRIVFPSALPEPPLESIPCVQALPVSLSAGASYVRHFFVLLRGTRVRAVLNVSGLARLRTPMLHVQLGQPDPPSIQLRTSPVVQALVTDSDPATSGHLYYTDWYVCGTGAGAYVGGQTFVERLPSESGGSSTTYSGLVMDWTRTVNIVLPQCSHPHEWHLAVGRIGHSPAYLNYRRP